MFREKINELANWKIKPSRKPLMLNGARQVGKSWLVQKFGESYFTGKVITLNFEKRRDLHIIFKHNFDVNRILLELEFALGIKIDIANDLLFFDEIQACADALGSLRYFYEDKKELHLIAAGSLLDFEFRNQPFPVGRVDVMSLTPMTFYEFLLARKKDSIANILNGIPTILPEVVTGILNEEINNYFVVGGMPECVQSFVNNQNFNDVQEIQDNLLYAYEQDFKKYKPTVDGDALNDILEKSASLISNQIIYTHLSDRFSSPTIKKGVEVLRTARLLNAVQNVSIAGLPLSPSGKQFKLFHLDIGLLLQKSKLSFQDIYLKKNLTAAFNGMLAEQFVAQQMIATQKEELAYWARTSPGSSAEVDFVIVRDGKIIPIEVKSGRSGSLKSLHYLLEHHPHISQAIIFSNAPFGIQEKLYFIPIYWAGKVQFPLV
ncbi:AAA family ATPase [Arcicella aquatica]|uniref:AAA family ATPase n=1 Tax=Arcicella aquatica TaxID=217141 RepID=A0ABU5QMJ2_9BACT|nr:AAA family ATPase [Arcicella aquatica]MEA5257964.1 AAA family ATPase [Arcicella aquatica]